MGEITHEVLSIMNLLLNLKTGILSLWHALTMPADAEEDILLLREVVSYP